MDSIRRVIREIIDACLARDEVAFGHLAQQARLVIEHWETLDPVQQVEAENGINFTTHLIADTFPEIRDPDVAARIDREIL